ncbi:MAG: hypothetical protein JWO80_4186 [Bryobacterales bacterium]|nr:hypothetical protein [Bryobacterales bacterium]
MSRPATTVVGRAGVGDFKVLNITYAELRAFGLQQYASICSQTLVLHSRVLQQAATSNIQSGTSKTRQVRTSSKLQHATPWPRLTRTGMQTK